MSYAYPTRRTINIWPGFVDALAALLMVIMFMLLIFAIGQFYLTETLSVKEKTLVNLDKQVAELANLLSLEEDSSEKLRETLGELTAQLSLKSKNNELLQTDVDLLMEIREQLEKEVALISSELNENSVALSAEQEISVKSLAQIEILNRQVKALREQLGTVSKALGLDLDVQSTSVDKLAERLNVALAEKAQELARYRSDFFGRLREVLGENPDIQIVGDRFVLQSELLFESGSAELGEKGKSQVKKLSQILNSVAENIPTDIEWIVRIDGHTDRRPISNEEYPSNWELSTARALAIVRYMVAQEVPAKRLAATGFGEFHPLDDEKTNEAYTKNRRIEIKLTSR
ncbi:MAG: peptidoglycan -binding protein [Gammaproteobacteria bacterium]